VPARRSLSWNLLFGRLYGAISTKGVLVIVAAS
jgi:hypothetical protein